MRSPREIGPQNQSDVEQAYDEKDAKTKLTALHHHEMHRRFGSKTDDHISGRPHWLDGWLGGILTHLGYRRR
jgi:hypothetical protein